MTIKGRPQATIKKLLEDLPPVGGLCAEVDPDIFFPEKGESTHAAKRVCQSCPVMAQCLDWAFRNDERFGVLGGMSAKERQKVRRTPLSPGA